MAELECLAVAGKRKDLVSDLQLQPLLTNAKYVKLEQLSQQVDLEDDRPAARAQRAEVSI